MSIDLARRDGGPEPIEAEIVSYDVADVTRTEIDIQISTAKRWPRDIQKFLRDTETLAVRTKEMARACMYTLPARSGGGQPIVGPSVRLAEIALHCYGNVRATVRIASEQDRFIVAQFSGIDLERNVGVQVEVRRRITDRNGRRFSDDMIVMTGNAASAIALRNGIWKLIPAALIEPIFAKVRAVALGSDTDIAQERGEWVKYWNKQGIKNDALFATLSVSGIEGIGVEQIEAMVGWQTGIAEGSLKLAAIFAPPAPEPQAEDPAASRTDRLAETLRNRGKTPPNGPKDQPAAAAREPGQEG
jgi:hypothetical protein